MVWLKQFFKNTWITKTCHLSASICCPQYKPTDILENWISYIPSLFKQFLMSTNLYKPHTQISPGDAILKLLEKHGKHILENIKYMFFLRDMSLTYYSKCHLMFQWEENTIFISWRECIKYYCNPPLFPDGPYKIHIHIETVKWSYIFKSQDKTQDNSRCDVTNSLLITRVLGENSERTINVLE